MDFAYDTTTTELQERLTAFMEEFVYPAEETFFEQRAKLGDRWSSPAIVEELKAAARAQGLWNLFLPRTHEYGVPVVTDFDAARQRFRERARE